VEFSFREISLDDYDWIAKTINSDEVSYFLLDIVPKTENEVLEAIKRRITGVKDIVCELDGVPVGYACISLGIGRVRHVATLMTMYVRREYWGRGIGSALIGKVVSIAKEEGCRKVVLWVFEDNDRAIRIYEKVGFIKCVKLPEVAYIGGKWRNVIIMSLDINKGELGKNFDINYSGDYDGDLYVRYIKNRDLGEINRLQNCPESTKSTHLIPPTSMDATRRWYEEINSLRGLFAYGCYENEKMLGYVRFIAGSRPFDCVWIREVLVDVFAKPLIASEALLSAVINFKVRYGYHRIIYDVPVVADYIIKPLEKLGFKKAGVISQYYLIDESLVDSAYYIY